MDYDFYLFESNSKIESNFNSKSFFKFNKSSKDLSILVIRESIGAFFKSEIRSEIIDKLFLNAIIMFSLIKLLSTSISWALVRSVISLRGNTSFSATLTFFLIIVGVILLVI